jgi:15-cis-phytoene synthase
VRRAEVSSSNGLLPEAAYANCRRMLRRHDPTYHLAVSRLPRERRAAVHALYGFVRGADEIVDGAGSHLRPHERRAALDEWEQELERGMQTGSSDHPVIAALVHAAGTYDLPVAELRPYIASMRMDCGRLRIQTREELERYMDGSGASVGRIMAVILGAPEESERLGRLGVAFQLTNFLRDLREDYVLDRIYLPADEREQHGVGESDLAAASASPSLRELVAAEVRVARGLFAETAPALAAAIPSARRGIGFARAVYCAVLDRIERNGYDVLGRSSRPRLFDFARVVAHSR